MTYNLDITRPANRDLDQIVSYIALELKNPKAARRLYKLIRSTYQSLQAHPEMFEYAKDRRIAAKGFRIAPVEHYVIAYKVDKTNKKVVIHDVFFGARAYQDLL